MSILSTDFHTHILPGIDDGSKNVSDSVRMIQMEQRQGVERIVLTPHFHAQHINPEIFIQKREAAMQQLQDALFSEPIVPSFILGAEVSYCPGMSKWESLELLTIGDTRCLLIEMPAKEWNERVLSELEAIHYDRGITPIIAHVERCFHPIRLNVLLRRLSQLPVLFQMNCSFLNSKRTRKLALKIISEHNIHILGSDCHSSVWRNPDIDSARNLLIENLDKRTISFLSEFEQMVIQGRL